MSLSIITFCLWSFQLGATSAPHFSDFPVREIFKGIAVPPRINNQFEQRFKTRILEASRLGVQFAGHYGVAKWGCGTSCVEIALVNLADGRVCRGPFEVLTYGQAFNYDGGPGGLEYHADSELLVARGCPNEAHCATYYYVWNERQYKFRQIGSRPPHPIE